jgi:light-regulated signal transduction histidine kinase (bacteriophytochrome)
LLRDDAEGTETKKNDLDELTYIISHDLREPLRMITNYLQLLNKRYGENLDENARDYIRYAVDGSSKMKQMMDDLLTYSRIGKENFNADYINLTEVIDKVKKNLASKYSPEKYSITENFTDSSGIKGDEALLAGLLYNLIENALKFNLSEKPSIEINLNNDDNYWVLSVKDNGMGIDKDYHKKIFGIFQKLHNHTEYPGSGLGLAICEKIARRHNGTIWVESEAGQGATFYISISKEFKA